MDAVKKYGLVVLNAVIFVATLTIYFLYVAGASDAEAELEKKLERSSQNLSSLARQKPTPAWYEALESDKGLLVEEKAKLLAPILSADAPLDQFFSLDDREAKVQDAPTAGRYPEFKELMQAKWTALLEKHQGEEAELLCDGDVFKSVEPSWLRSIQTPSTGLQVSEAMKKYWITEEVVNILEQNGVKLLKNINISINKEHESYKKGEQLFWGFRDLELEVVGDSKQLSALIRAFHESALRFRFVGFDLENVIETPNGVKSNAQFVSFTDPELQTMRLKLMHFDYIKDGEALSFTDATGGGASSSGQTPRRGRRRR